MPILPGQTEGDYQKENQGYHPKHPTYYNKPTPTLQLISQHAEFNERGRSSLAYPSHVEAIINPDIVPAVPTTWDSVYDPDHPDADWTGCVSRNHQQKRHNQSHPSLRENIIRTQEGIVSSVDCQEFARKRPPEDPSVALRNTAGSIIIGGIDQPDERWKTTHHRFESKEPTARDQLTLEKRANPIKAVPDPAQTRTFLQQQQMLLASENAYLSARQDYQQTTGSGGGGMMGRSGRGSLLAGIGEKLAPAVTIPSQSRTQSRSNLSTTGNGGHTVDTSRLLIVDNYRPYAPGGFLP
eukprot:scaffold801_cov178-Ochromonas_danica.AAC.9